MSETLQSSLPVHHYDPKAKKKRIPPERWELYKDAIETKYKSERLEQVVKEMKDEYGFEATNRQYVHQLGKWGIAKYKLGSNGKKPSRRISSSRVEGERTVRESGTPEQDQTSDDDDDSPPLSTPERIGSNIQSHLAAHDLSMYPDEIRRRYLAEILFASGDSSSFPIYAELCRASSTGQILPDLIACTRAAQTETQAEGAQMTLQHHLDTVLDGYDEVHSSLATLVELQAARTYDHGSDTPNAIGQIEQRITQITHDENGVARFNVLIPRGHALDVPLFLYLSYGLARWNEVGTGEIRTDELLRQFVTLQLDGLNPPGTRSVEPFQKLPCLDGCLHFCADALKNNRFIHEGLRNLPLTYQVVGTVWHHWIFENSFSLTKRWAEGAQEELGISATELLVTVVCMIMAKADTRPGPQDPMAKALDGLNGLESMSREAIFYLFLRQLRRNNDSRMLAPRIPAERVSPEVVGPFRTFIYTTLGISLPGIDYNLPVHPLVLASADDIQAIENMYPPMPSSSRGRYSLAVGLVPPLQQPPHNMTLRSYSSPPGSSDGLRGR